MSIYVAQEIEPPAKMTDGSIMPMTGKYDIRETFNMTLCYTAYGHRHTEHIVELLNLHGNPEYVRDDLQKLVILIRECIHDWIRHNSNGNYEDGINCVLGKVVRIGKGRLNPDFIVGLIEYDRLAWKDFNGYMPC